MHRLVDCSKFEAEVAPPREPIFESGESAGAIPILAAVAAVVETQDVTCAGGRRRESSCAVCDRLHPRDQPLGCGGVPVARYQRPHDGAQIQFAGSACKPWIAKTEGRAKPFGRGIQRVGNRVLATPQFFPDLRWATREKIRMGFGVVANHVTSGDNFTDQVRALPRILADQEKCGVSVVTIEEVQEVWGDRGIWAVVERER